jgi:adenosylcobinamide-phosphate synthase
MFLAMSAALALLAMLIELALGYPQWLFRTVGHPVSWTGRLIGILDRHLNHDGSSDGLRRIGGVLTVLMVAAAAGSAAYLLQHFLSRLPYGLFAAALVASSFVAQRSLYRHVADVATALETGGVEAGRAAVAHIVGRDAAALDAAGVARAAIESLAENFSDAIVAPVLWMVIAGLPGAAVYKAINTADSMIGHLTKRHAAFGWAAARLDDLVNLPASRLAAMLLMLGAATGQRFDAGSAWHATWQDASHHRSPNAGYPEAAMAGALGLALAGPRIYDGVEVDDAVMGFGRRDADAGDIRRALSLFRRADAALILLLVLLAALLIAPA